MNATEIANKLNESDFRYYGEAAKGWSKNGIERIYFGREYVTFENGLPTNKSSKARANTIGSSAVEACEAVIQSN